MYIHDSCIAIYLSPACKSAIYENDEIANSFDKGGKPASSTKHDLELWVDPVLTIRSL